jgi:protein-tyrosine phosphatase
LRQVLFLCTGNYYRSRYAEEVFNHLAERERLAWKAVSRAAAERCSPENVGPMSRFALEALSIKGINPQGAERYPVPCSRDDFKNVNRVVALKEAEHRPMIERRFPGLVNSIEYWDVDDIEFVSPSKALPKIDELVEWLIRDLQTGHATRIVT